MAGIYGSPRARRRARRRVYGVAFHRGVSRGRMYGYGESGIGLGTLAVIGGLAWLVFGRKAAPVVVPSGVREGIAVPMRGETVESYQARAQAGTLPYITALEGLGNAGGQAWYSWQLDGPSGALAAQELGPF